MELEGDDDILGLGALDTYLSISPIRRLLILS